MRSHSLFMARQKGTTSLENQIGNRPWVHPLARRWRGRKRCQGQSNLRVHFMPPEGKPQEQEWGESGKRKRKGVFPFDWSIQSPEPKPILWLRKVEVPTLGTLTYDLSGLGSRVWTWNQYERKPSSKIASVKCRSPILLLGVRTWNEEGIKNVTALHLID